MHGWILRDVPNAVPSGDGTENLSPLGLAGNTARLHLEAAGSALPDAQASVAVNSLGLLDLVQIAAEGLAPKAPLPIPRMHRRSCCARANSSGCHPECGLSSREAGRKQANDLCIPRHPPYGVCSNPECTRIRRPHGAC